jgi:hypothetical protein
MGYDYPPKEYDPREDAETTGRVVPSGVIPRKQKWFGLTIDVENPRGSWRIGNGWSTFMNWDYGYIRGVGGEDGEEIDVYLGPYLATAPKVYVIHQRKAPDFTVWDEDKVMIGFPDERAAKLAYESQYSNPGFFGTMEEFPTTMFVAYVKKHHKVPGKPLVTSQDLARQLALLAVFPEHLLEPLPLDTELTDLSGGQDAE